MSLKLRYAEKGMENPILEVLLDDGIITEKDVAEIRRKRKDVAEYLIENGFFGESSYCEWFSRTFGFEMVDDSEEPNISLVKIFPREVLLEHMFLPLRYSSGVLVIASSDPFSVPLKRIYEFCGSVKVEMKICSPLKIRRHIRSVFGDGEKGGIEEFVDRIIDAAIRMGATDVHIFPQEPCIKFRVNGLLTRYMGLSRLSFQLLVNRIKVISGLDIAEKRLPQDGRFSTLGHDVRVSVVPTSYGEKVALRILRRNIGFSLHDLGLSEGQIRIIRRGISRSSGFIFVAGPTGHGKTTTVYSMLREIDRERLNTISIEDPIEYDLDGVSQIQVNEEIGLSFAKVLRHVLRQNPDVIFVGEIRDAETADIALKAALTGHLVLTTIHARDVASGIMRFENLGCSLDVLLSTLVLGISQRLLRISCGSCEGAGCHMCNHTGTGGLEGVFEVIFFDEELRSRIKSVAKRGELAEFEIRRVFRDFGYSLLEDELSKKMTEGKVKESDLMEIL